MFTYGYSLDRTSPPRVSPSGRDEDKKRAIQRRTHRTAESTLDDRHGLSRKVKSDEHLSKI